MRVRYTPPLREQIKGHHKAVEMARARPVALVDKYGHVLEHIDSITRKCTGEPQQFKRNTDDSLTILPRYQWVENPDIISVDHFKLG